MWIVRWSLISAIIIFILGLALQNTALVEITIFRWHSGKIPIYLVIYVAFAAGMITFLLLSVYQQIQAQIDLRRCRKEMRRLQDELAAIKTEQIEESEQLDKPEMEPDGNPSASE